MTPEQRTDPTNLRTFVGLVAFVAIAAAAHYARIVVVPLLLAFLTAMLLDPFVDAMGRRRVPRVVGVILVVVGVAVLFIGAMAVLGRALADFASKLPRYRGALDERVQWLADKTGGRVGGDGLGPLVEQLDVNIAVDMARTVLQSATTILASFLVILLVVFFLLLEIPKLDARVEVILESPGAARRVYTRFLDSLQRYFLIKTLVSAGTGLFAGFGVWLAGVDFPVLWGFLAFALNYIPNVGSLVASIPPVLLALIQNGPGNAIVVIAVYLAANGIFGNLLEPRVMGDGLGLSPVMIILSLVFWGFILGTVGVLLAVPLTMTIKLALESRPSSRRYAAILGPTPETDCK